MKCCVTTRCKDEQNVLEWVDYHLAVGFDQVIIFDDLSTTPVSSIVYPRFSNDQCKVLRPGVVTSKKRKHFLFLQEIRTFDYALDLDMDEYLYPGDHLTVQGLINAYQPFDMIKLHFLMYGNNGYKKRIEDGCLDIFTKSHDYLNRTGKAIGKVCSIKGKTSVHHWDLKSRSVVKNIGDIEKKINDNPSQLPPCVAHYAVQDTYNFVRRRIRRDGFKWIYGCGPEYVPRTNELVDYCHDNSFSEDPNIKKLVARFVKWNMNTITNNVVKSFYHNLKRTVQEMDAEPPQQEPQRPVAVRLSSQDIFCKSVQLTMKPLTDIQSYWPKEKPAVVPFMHGWFCQGKGNDAVLTKLLRQYSPKIVVELGSWYGMSAKWIAEKIPPESLLICVDRWDNNFIKEMWSGRGKNYKNRVPFIDQHPLYETFLVNMWEYAQRVLPIRSDTLAGLQKIHDLDLKPDLIYIDAGHEYESVKKELTLIAKLFPTAKICGDDWRWKEVQRAVQEHATNRGFAISTVKNCWYYV